MSIETRLEKLEGKSGLKDQPIAFFTWHDSRDDAALEAMKVKYADGLLLITYYDAKPSKLEESR